MVFVQYLLHYRQLLHQFQSPAMADNSDVFRMLSAEDKLDGDSNYPLWPYMIQHVLVSKEVWNIVQGFHERPVSADPGSVEDVTGSSSSCCFTYC